MNTNVKEILVIGLGLIGSSVAKVSREKGIKVHGFDINEDSLKPVSYTHLKLPTKRIV